MIDHQLIIPNPNCQFSVCTYLKRDQFYLFSAAWLTFKNQGLKLSVVPFRMVCTKGKKPNTWRLFFVKVPAANVLELKLIYMQHYVEWLQCYTIKVLKTTYYISIFFLNTFSSFAFLRVYVTCSEMVNLWFLYCDIYRYRRRLQCISQYGF